MAHEPPTKAEAAYRVRASALCGHYVYRIGSAGARDRDPAADVDAVAATQRSVRNVLVVDNSASMGQLTRYATQTIGRGMFALPRERVKQVPGTVISFDTCATVLSGNVKAPQDIDALSFPRQGSTNITAGIRLAVEEVIADGNTDVHYLMTFLSDGAHNCGRVCSVALLAEWRERIDAAGLSVSVIVVGVGSPDTSLGMRIKTGLETVPMCALDSVYYAHRAGDMAGVLAALTEGCVTSLCSGEPVAVAVEGGVFAGSESNLARLFISDAETLAVVRADGAVPPRLTIDGKAVACEETAPLPSLVMDIVDTLVPQLSQAKIAHGTGQIAEVVAGLERLADDADVYFRRLREEAEHAAGCESRGLAEVLGREVLPVQARLRLLAKRQRQEATLFAEARNKLKQLLAAVGNDSAAQAAYLTGMGRKYAAKALARSHTEGAVTPAEALASVRAALPRLAEALAADAAEYGGGDPAGESILSLCTAREQLAEWAAAAEAAGAGVEDVYSVLVGFGLPGYAVEFVRNNAVQMDPFQTSCVFVEPCPVDTASLMLANRLEHEVRTTSRRAVQDTLVLVSPAAPRATRAVMRTGVYEHVCSVALCRDLYMYHPRMTFSMHAHAFVKAAGDYAATGSSAYLALCVRIAYSIRKYWGRERCTGGDNVALFRRWWSEWVGVTQSEDDACAHPVQLVLMLAALDLPALGVWEDGGAHVTETPLLNLLNEWLARGMKAKLRGMGRTDEERTDRATAVRAVALAQDLLGVTAANSPKPSKDVLEAEPAEESVREACQAWAAVDTASDAHATLLGGDTPEGHVDNALRDVVAACAVGLAVQRHLAAAGTTWDALEGAMEACGGLPDTLLAGVSAACGEVGTSSVAHLVGVADGAGRATLGLNMVLQALLLHTSAARQGLTAGHSVRDAATTRELVVDLRMAHYRAACAVKRQAWLAAIGDVSYADALRADPATFKQMLGVHTHGLARDQFWGILAAAVQDDDKLQVFLAASNYTVPRCVRRATRRYKGA